MPLPELQAGEEQLPAVGKVHACLTSSCAIESKSCKITPPDLGAGGIPACTSMAPQPELQPRGCLQKHRDLPHTLCSCGHLLAVCQLLVVLLAGKMRRHVQARLCEEVVGLGSWGVTWPVIV